jgi:hypothetical protein
MVTAKAERAHALLSASSSKQWLACTPSARLAEQFPESTSDYAEEGRLAHEIAELKMRKAFTEPMGLRAFNTRLKKLKEHPLFKEEMLRHTDTYLEYVSGIVHGFSNSPYMAVEKRLDYSAYAPEGFGTGDCIIIGGNRLIVNDFKYGKGVPVSAIGNTQMRLYALGAYLEYSFLYPIDTVEVAIIQPRLDDISVDRFPVELLLAWGESIKPAAQKAFAGEGEFVPGDHCQFCPAKAVCRARAEANIVLEDEFKLMKPPLISNEEVGQILARAQNLAAWAKHLEGYALTETLNGREIPGWKAVHGRGSRQYTDQDAAFRFLQVNNVSEAMLYKREPLTVPAVEELLGKEKFKELLTPFVETKPGKPTLAPLSDKREPIQRTSAADDFKSEEEPSNE